MNGKYSRPHPVSRWKGFQDFPRVPIEAKEGKPFRFVDEPRRCYDAIDIEGQLVVHGTGAGGRVGKIAGPFSSNTDVGNYVCDWTAF